MKELISITVGVAVCVLGLQLIGKSNGPQEVHEQMFAAAWKGYLLGTADMHMVQAMIHLRQGTLELHEAYSLRSSNFLYTNLLHNLIK